MCSNKLLKAANVVIKKCLNVKKGETVLILTDSKVDQRIINALYQAALEIGALPTIAILPPRNSPTDEPPNNVVSAMRSSDVIIGATSITLYHTKARVIANNAGARFISIPNPVIELFTSDAMFADFIKIKPKIELLANLMTRAKEIKLTTPAGTNIIAKIDGRKANAESGICHVPGCCTGVPGIEVNIAPIENSTEGKIVVDGTISIFPGLVKEPIIIYVRNGRAEKIIGKEEALKLKEVLDKLNDPNVFIIAEIAVGFNPKSKVRGISPAEDESALGTAHIALGDNIALGGSNKASIHVDLVIKQPKIWLDGKLVFDTDHLIL